MSDVFVSYSHRDEHFARQLAEALSIAGVDVWIDVDDIPVGMKWSSAIMQGLQLCEVMILIITPDAMNSGNVEDEWQYFLDQGKPVVPVLRKPANIHFQLNRLQWVDFYNQPFDVALEYLFLELESLGIRLKPGTIVNRPTIIGRKPESLPTRRQARSRTSGRALALLVILFALLMIGGAAALVLMDTNRRNQSTVSGSQTNTAQANLDAGQTAVAAEASQTQAASLTLAAAALSATDGAGTDTAGTATAQAAVATVPATPEITITAATNPFTLAAANAVNVRSGDGPDYAQLDTLARGQMLTLLARSRLNRRWYYLEYAAADGVLKRGWVDGVILGIPTNLDTTTLPTLTPDQAAELP